jgi:RNA 2',3'-cyclic 3'-phosphodiesterase
MRLFIGVELDHRVKVVAADVAERLRQRLQRATRDLQARWTAPENLHITLWFIGEASDSEGEAIVEALTQPTWSIPAFPLVVAGCGAFPPSGRPRVFWIAVQQGTQEMRRLYAEVAARLAPVGYVPEGREYTPHLTIARVKDAGRGSLREIRSMLAQLPADCGTSRVTAVTLFRSRLSPKGATYEPLLRVPLS